MLIELFGHNFGSFRDEFQLSLLATDIDRDSQRGIVEVAIEGDPEPLRLLRAAAIYGPNASGKSTVLRAASALGRLLRGSHQRNSDSELPEYEPFKFGPWAHQPSTLGAKAVIDGAVYEYSVAFDKRKIHDEQLVRLHPTKQEELFRRKADGITGAWLEDRQFAWISKNPRANVLLLGLADITVPDVADDIATGLRHHLTYVNRSLEVYGDYLANRRVASRAKENQRFREWLSGQLRGADTGIVGLELYQTPRGRAWPGQETGPEPIINPLVDELRLAHGNGDNFIYFDYDSESTGTHRIVDLAPHLFDLVHGDKEQTMFIDEFDASLHPSLVNALIQQFNCDAVQVRGQLVFTTHETSLIDGDSKEGQLRRDQVYFTDKDPSGASRLFSLAEFRERNNLNIRKRYLEGRYGALPLLSLRGA